MTGRLRDWLAEARTWLLVAVAVPIVLAYIIWHEWRDDARRRR